MKHQYQQVYIWSRYLRLFHWANVLIITILLALGLVIYNAKTLGISVDGKVLLKTIHVLTGYIFATNLIIRIIFGFIGKGYERWHNVLPFAKGFTQELIEFKKHPNTKYKGHSPLGKLMVGALLLTMSIQMLSGLVLAGTDIYYPPFGQYFAKSIAIESDKLDLIKPYSTENVDQQAYKEMRAIRAPFITAHVYSFFTLLFLIPLHIIGVIMSERKERTAILSAMINGYKYLPKNNDESS
ncbi:cytochrome b/b6 domain-containing protein [Thalassotalea piscium]|uniref:Cytochrome b n=1 Tax=Thalassotalea piscium TaxID=1230533 RepID=A0A7X0TV33_9GAMM|nr:cytochrome b/b6 domain-containing protein [Thalassotalea piscium]MBB6544921.1 cytochrome b [Thalassotalea piscium]